MKALSRKNIVPSFEDTKHKGNPYAEFIRAKEEVHKTPSVLVRI